MLELRPTCEHCDRPLPPHSTEAMICTFECTYCRDCALNVLANVCPNCGGNFVARPIRPKAMLKKYPASTEKVHNPVDLQKHAHRMNRLKDVTPENR